MQESVGKKMMVAACHGTPVCAAKRDHQRDGLAVFMGDMTCEGEVVNVAPFRADAMEICVKFEGFL